MYPWAIAELTTTVHHSWQGERHLEVDLTSQKLSDQSPIPRSHILKNLQENPRFISRVSNYPLVGSTINQVHRVYETGKACSGIVKVVSLHPRFIFNLCVVRRGDYGVIRENDLQTGHQSIGTAARTARFVWVPAA